VAAFPSEVQNGVCAQLADCLVAVICQRLVYRPDLKIQVPECEILMPAHAVKNFIRRGEFFKMMSSMETGANDGMWTYQRYRTWLDTRKTWHMPGEKTEEEPAGDLAVMDEVKLAPPPLSRPSTAPAARSPSTSAPKPSAGKPGKGNALEIVPEEGGLEAIISKLKDKP
jgi:twitching motility protein PilT